jgi:hypothetical protein
VLGTVTREIKIPQVFIVWCTHILIYLLSLEVIVEVSDGMKNFSQLSMIFVIISKEALLSMKEMA